MDGLAVRTSGRVPLSYLAAPDLRRLGRSGCGRAHAHDGDRDRPARPRLSVFRAARLGQDLGGEDPGPLHRVRSTARRPTPDNTCANCVAILDGTAFDVVEIDAASNRGIDEIRALRDAVKFPPSVDALESLHHRRSAHADQRRRERVSQDARRTAAARRLHPRDDRARSAAADDSVALPALRVPAHPDRDDDRAHARDRGRRRHRDRRRGAGRDRLPRRRRPARRAHDARTGRAFGGGARRRRRRSMPRSARPAARSRSRCATRRSARDAAAALRTIDDASDAGTDMPGLIRALIAEFRHLLVARVNPELLARDLAADDAAAAEARARTSRRRASCARCALFGDALGRRARRRATRGWNSRRRCCASCCKVRTRRSMRSRRASPRSKAATAGRPRRRRPRPPRAAPGPGGEPRRARRRGSAAHPHPRPAPAPAAPRGRARRRADAGQGALAVVERPQRAPRARSPRSRRRSGARRSMR